LSGSLWGSLYDSYSTAEVRGQKWSGGLIGSASVHEEITRCVATGNVYGTKYVGGLIGNAAGNIDNCSAHGDVVGEDEGVGGLIGTKSGGILENCFATGDVIADSEVGGLIGISRWNLSDCYSTGRVTGTLRTGASIGINNGNVDRIYFNNQTSGISAGIGAGTLTGVAGKNFEDMLQNSTFKDWNFTDIWGIGNGQTYPYFKWKDNEPPVITTSDVRIASIRAPYIFPYNRIEVDYTDIFPYWSLETNAGWLQVNSSTGFLHGTPGPSDNGPYFVNISVNDGRNGIDYHNFTLTMNSTNNVPRISTDPVRYTDEDDLYYVDYEASIDVGDVLDWSLTTNASWLHLDRQTGVLTGLPDYTEIGTYSMNVTVTDGQGAVEWQEFTLTVNETNDDPIITTKDVTETYEHLLYQVQYSATDEENDAMVWSFRSNASWLSFNKVQRILTGRPGYGKVGLYWVNISVLDVRGGFDLTNFTLGVIDHPIPNGSGTISDPFLIMNATQLQSANLDLDAHYILGQDIDASETRNWNDGKGFVPIASNIGSLSGHYYKGGRFNGTFDGKDFTIYDLWINRPDTSYIGLFGYIDSGSFVSNVRLKDINIKGNSTVGGLAGDSNWADISHCYIEGKVYGNFIVGGLVGYNFYTSIRRCNVNIDVIGSSHVGGLIGWGEGWGGNGVIQYCSSRGFVRGGEVMGGCAGFSNHMIRSSFSNCIVNGTGYLGGFVGVYDGHVSAPIWDCYSTGDVIGTEDYIAGFVGLNRNLIARCYSTGEVISISQERIWTGPFTATSGTSGDGLFENCTVHYRSYPQGNVGVIYHPDVKTKSTDEMVRRSTFKNMGWDLDNVWSQIDKHSYPYFSWQDNEPPSIMENDNLTVYENISYSVKYNSTDPDPTDIYAIWSIATNATWLSMDKDTGVLTGNASNNDLGSYWLNITASDGRGGSDWHNITIEVINTNPAPVILTRAVTSVKEDVPYIVDYEGIDPDPTNDVLVWSMISNAPWLEIDEETGVLSGYPANSDVGEYWVKVALFDGKGAYDIQEFTLTVINVNDPPQIITSSIPDAVEDEFYSYPLTGKDIDPSDDIFSWSIAGTNAHFINIRIFEGVLVGYPRNEDVGSRWVLVTLDDGRGGTDTMNYTFEVVNTNDPPVILTTELPDAFENEFYSFSVEMEDEDPVKEEHYWTMVTNSDFLSIDQYTGQIMGTPGDFDVGVWKLTIMVTDDSGGKDIANLSLMVIGRNDPPGIYREQVQITIEEDSNGALMDLNDLYYDLENDQLTYSVSPCSNLSFTLVSSYILNITSRKDWSGMETFRVTAFDGEFDTSLNVTVIVTQVNDPPTNVMIHYTGPYVEGGPQIVEGYASDPDIPFGDDLEFRWSINSSRSLGAGRKINLSLPAGFYRLTLRVTDSEGSFNETSISIRIDPLQNETTPDEREWYEGPYIIIPTALILGLILSGLIFVYFHRDRDRIKRDVHERDITHEHAPYQQGRRAPLLFDLDVSPPLHPTEGREIEPERHYVIGEQQSRSTTWIGPNRSRYNKPEATHISLDTLIEEGVRRSEGYERRFSKEEMLKDLNKQYERGIIEKSTYSELKEYLR